MPGKRLKASERRVQIIKKATELFSSNSFEKVTVGMVAEACGITEPALYRHFSSKKKIYEEVLNALSQKIEIGTLSEEVKSIDDIEDLLYAFGRHLLELNITHQELSRLLLFASLEKHSLARQVFTMVRKPYIELLSKKLKEQIKSRKIRNVNPLITARCFVGMVMDCAVSINLWSGFQGKRYKIEDVLKNNIPIYVRGLKLN